LAAADVSWVHVKSLKGLDGAGRWDLDMNIASFIDWGNVEVAYHLLDDKIQAGGWGFNNLFRDVLVFPGCKEVDGKKKAAKKTEKKTTEVSKDDALLSPSAVIRPVSVVKKSHTSKNMTPLHCASINTNPAYLEKLLSICPETNIQDNRRKRPVHFAAASRSPACLKVLLGRGASPDEVCAAGNTALFYAAKTGRRENVELLIKRGLDQIATGIAVDKFGVAGLNRGNRSSYCPLHVAVQNGHIKVVELLLKHGAAIEKPLSATKNKVTPLMLACQKGDMNMVRVLASHGAKLDDRDKLKRSPLMHAVINGQTAVASLLIHSGVALDHVDTSGNSALLYAVAYGWYFSVKLLIDCGADLDLANMWKVPPLGIAFLKGHLGLFEYILDASDSVDINYKDLQGFTLVMSILKGTEADLVLSQLEYLVTEKKAKCDLVDLKGNSCLHVLCTNKTLICQDKKLMIEAPKEKKERKSVLLSAAKLLIKAGCSTNAVNESGDTAVSIAAGNGCVQLMTLLLDSGASLVPPLPSTVLDEDGGKKNNILHYLSSFADQKEVLEFFVKIGDDINNGGGDELIKVDSSIKWTLTIHISSRHPSFYTQWVVGSHFLCGQ
jgi:ankyrin repeat protein